MRVTENEQMSSLILGATTMGNSPVDSIALEIGWRLHQSNIRHSAQASIERDHDAVTARYCERGDVGICKVHRGMVSIPDQSLNHGVVLREPEYLSPDQLQ